MRARGKVLSIALVGPVPNVVGHRSEQRFQFDKHLFRYKAPASFDARDRILARVEFDGEFHLREAELLAVVVNPLSERCTVNLA